MSSQREKDTTIAAGSPVAEQSLRTVIGENVDGMLVIDREGVVIFANPAAERLLGRAAQALTGTPLGFPVVAGESTEIDVIAGPAPRTAEMRVVAIGWEGRPAALAALRDVTERKQAEEELRRLSAELGLRARWCARAPATPTPARCAAQIARRARSELGAWVARWRHVA